MQECKMCGNEFPPTEEYFYKSGKYLNKTCKSCYNKNCYKRKVKEKEKYKKKSIEYAKNPKRKEYLKEYLKTYSKEYYKKHSEELKQKQRDYNKTHEAKLINEQWRNSENGRNIKLVRDQKRRTRKRNLPIEFTALNWATSEKHFDNECSYCGKKEKLTQDHFIPLSKGGGYTINNILPACGFCNRSKSDKNFFEWYPMQSFYSKDREQKIVRYLHYNKDVAHKAIFDN